MKIQLAAEPEAISIEPGRSAVCVVDMQNWDVKPGGFFERTGIDTTHGQRVIEPIRNVLDAARSAGMTVVYLTNIIPRNRAMRPNADSPWYWKGRQQYEDERGACIEGTWGAEIIEELTPADGDLVVRKSTYSGFVRTELDLHLRRKGVRHLILTGIGTPTCVEATARDAYFHEYWPIVLEDCCGGILPETHVQALTAIKRRYGWVTSSAELLSRLPKQEQQRLAAIGGGG